MQEYKEEWKKDIALKQRVARESKEARSQLSLVEENPEESIAEETT